MPEGILKVNVLEPCELNTSLFGIVMLVPANITNSTFSLGWKPVAVKLTVSPTAPEDGLTNNSAIVNALNASAPYDVAKSFCIVPKSLNPPPEVPKKLVSPPAPNPELKLDFGEMFESMNWKYS